MTDIDIAAGEEPSFARVTSLLRLLAIIAFLFIGLKIIRYGYLPVGDARRDAAQAVSGKAYTDVLVLRPEYQIDHNAGWDWLLRQLHTKAGLSEDGLMAFAVVGLLFGLCCAPLPWLRCPEAWIGAVLAFSIAMPGMILRWASGRPLLLTEGILAAVLLAWSRRERASWIRIVLTVFGFAASAWIHGTWYLWAMLPFAFFLAGHRRAALTLGFCWLGGSILGAAGTGHPWEYLKQAVILAGIIAREHAPAALRVGEFQPGSGVYAVLVILAAAYIWRRQRLEDVLRSPIFWLAGVCWILSLNAARFWDDWGLPAALIWLALQMEDAIVSVWAAAPRRRLALGVILLLALFFNLTSDYQGRYSDSLRETFVDAGNPALKGWMPEPGGIFYGAEMTFFFDTFYKNPAGDWRYLTGFEPAWMPADDLKTFRAVQWSKYSWTAYQPWVDKMRPIDRLEISGGTRPDLPPLEWTLAGDIWIGRIRQNRPAK